MNYSDLINKCKKEWNCDTLMDGSNANQYMKIPFSSPMLNYATYGGIPRNKLTEFLGKPNGGKTSTALDICKNAIKIFSQEYIDKLNHLKELAAKGDKAAYVQIAEVEEQGRKKVLYIDLEHGYDSRWGKIIGINPEDIDVMQPPDIAADDLLQKILEIIETGQVGLIVIDSIPSLVPRAVLEKKIGERTVAALAGLMTTFCYKVIPLLTRYGTTMIFINQLRDNMENPYVINTPGGEAIKYYSILRIHFSQGKPVDFLGNELPQSTENPAGYIINAKLIKQKGAPFDRKLGTYYLMTQTGIRPDYDFAQLAIKQYGIIKKSGAWYSFIDPYTGEIMHDENNTIIKVNGMAKVYDYLQSNKEYYDKLCKYIVDDINGKDPEMDVAENSKEDLLL